MDLIIAAFYRAGLLTLNKAHNRTQLGTGLNVLNKLMKSTHRTQARHDKNLSSCETRPSWKGVSAICLFICLFDSPRRSARGTGGPTKVRCQCGEHKIEQSRTSVKARERERLEKIGVRERETQGRKCGWLGRWFWQCRMDLLRISSGKTKI